MVQVLILVVTELLVCIMSAPTVADGCRSSVAERWWLKPEALGSIPGDATFLSFPLPFQRSSDSNGPDYL